MSLFVARPVRVKACQLRGIGADLPLEFAAEARRRRAARGDWIIRDGDGTWSVLADGPFQNTYAPAEAEAPPAPIPQPTAPRTGRTPERAAR